MPNSQPAQKQPDIKEIMADYDKAIKFFADTPAEAWEAIGQKTALSVFEETAKTIPAYQEFLKLQKINPENVKTPEDFYNLPVMDKYNYIQVYGFNEVNNAKAGKNLYSYSLSSGTVDEPTLWPRNYQSDDFLQYAVGNYIRQYWQVDKKSTLFINALALGPWNAGFTMYLALRPLTQKYNLTLANCGADIESIVYSVVKLSKHYDQTIILSYTTFCRTILDRLEKAGINFEKNNIKLFVGGEGHTAEWRQYINKLLTNDPEDITAIIDTYGISEVGVIGLSTAMTNLIRDLAFKNKKLREDLFGKSDCVPNMFQYNTAQVFLEDLNGEILLTSKSTTPLVRYNLHDRGGVIKFREMEEVLKKHGYDYKKLLKKKGLSEEIIWQQSFVYCFGRRNDTVIIAGANIYPEQVAPALFNDRIKDIHSFKLITDFDKEQHQLFYVLLELKSGISYNKKQMAKMKKKYHSLILKRLLKVNNDYAESLRADSKYADFIIEIFENGKGLFAEDKVRTKPRLVAK